MEPLYRKVKDDPETLLFFMVAMRLVDSGKNTEFALRQVPSPNPCVPYLALLSIIYHYLILITLYIYF